MAQSVEVRRRHTAPAQGLKGKHNPRHTSVAVALATALPWRH
jgi:hypothetical protein